MAKPAEQTIRELLARFEVVPEFLDDAAGEVTCSQCDDLRFIKMVIPEKDRYEGGPDHYYNPCSWCLPERYQIMVEMNCGRREHMERGGCSRCKKYIQPWTNQKEIKTYG